jgi:hypothetical protein
MSLIRTNKKSKFQQILFQDTHNELENRLFNSND